MNPDTLEQQNIEIIDDLGDAALDSLNFDSDSGQESEEEEDGENSEGEGVPPAIVGTLHLPAPVHE